MDGQQWEREGTCRHTGREWWIKRRWPLTDRSGLLLHSMVLATERSPPLPNSYRQQKKVQHHTIYSSQLKKRSGQSRTRHTYNVCLAHTHANSIANRANFFNSLLALFNIRARARVMLIAIKFRYSSEEKRRMYWMCIRQTEGDR